MPLFSITYSARTYGASRAPESSAWFYGTRRVRQRSRAYPASPISPLPRSARLRSSGTNSSTTGSSARQTSARASGTSNSPSPGTKLAGQHPRAGYSWSVRYSESRTTRPTLLVVRVLCLLSRVRLGPGHEGQAPTAVSHCKPSERSAQAADQGVRSVSNRP